MTRPELEALNARDFVTVAFGGLGKQIAQVLSIDLTRGREGRALVQKWRAQSRRWTCRAWVEAAALGQIDRTNKRQVRTFQQARDSAGAVKP